MIFNISKEDSHKSGIYIIENLINGKFYIGSTKDFIKRYQSHLGDMRRKDHANKKIQGSVNKYGIENFKFSVLEIIKNKELLRSIEQEYINVFNPELNLLKNTGKFSYKIKLKYKKNTEEVKKLKCVHCATSKLTESQVVEIINLINNNTSCEKIGKIYNVSYRSIIEIKNKMAYKHLSYLIKNDLLKDWSPLSDKDVIKIIMYLNLSREVKEIAEKYNVSLNCIRYIKKKKRWKQYSYLLK